MKIIKYIALILCACLVAVFQMGLNSFDSGLLNQEIVTGYGITATAVFIYGACAFIYRLFDLLYQMIFASTLQQITETVTLTMQKRYSKYKAIWQDGNSYLSAMERATKCLSEGVFKYSLYLIPSGFNTIIITRNILTTGNIEIIPVIVGVVAVQMWIIYTVQKSQLSDRQIANLTKFNGLQKDLYLTAASEAEFLQEVETIRKDVICIPKIILDYLPDIISSIGLCILLQFVDIEKRALFANAYSQGVYSIGYYGGLILRNYIQYQQYIKLIKSGGTQK